FVDHHPEVRIVGVILNRIGSSRHGTAIAKAVRATVPDVEILGKVPRSPDLELPARHLGLVQAGEAPDLEAFLDKAAGVVAKSVDLSRLQSLAEPLPAAQSSVQALGAALLLPPGQRVALARDEAFAFTYDGVLEDWRRDGVEISFFSPLNDEPIPKRADAVWLPGGYPELHAGRLAGAERFLRSLRAAAAHGLPVFGECGGYMLLGRGIIDADGHSHAMADLLPLETDFSPAGRRLRLGYRRARLLGDVPGLGKAGDRFNAHEFHYAGISWMGALSGTVSGGGAIAEPVFAVTDAAGIGLDPVGQRVGSVAGSFLHLIAKE
ncbi:MAG: cobyrinate a,c-diamide synthase, partial [Rhodospirillaceae bacterium]